MQKIIIVNPAIEQLNISEWNIWSCDISKFDGEYLEEETCYFFEGDVVVETDFERVELKPGDLVTFPKGLKCVWDIRKPVRKAYKFN
ncbi:MAG: hypothetical protein ACD_20C00214G0022 [uncultured bacterium]|nr:MAG: hypothetical protein ACD_20C00214G0022 [uncultured bacterium]HBH19165.1 cupin [Cyanobacteria bacterium UBA9579]